MQVIIIDDNATNVALMRKVLERIGCVSRVFTDSRAGLLAASAGDCDLVLIDYIMPDLDGIEWLRLFRAMPAGRSLPVMVITSADDAHTRDMARAAGATDFLGKPIDPIELRERVRDLVDAHHLGVDLRAGNF